MTLLIAEGPNFSFHAIGYSKAEVWHTLRKGWKIHQKQCGITTKIDDALTVNVIDKMEVGKLYRDYEPIGGK